MKCTAPIPDSRPRARTKQLGSGSLKQLCKLARAQNQAPGAGGRAGEPSACVPRTSNARAPRALRSKDKPGTAPLIYLTETPFPKLSQIQYFFWYRKKTKQLKKLRQSFLFSSLKKGKTKRMRHHNLSPSCLANLSGHIQYPNIDTHCLIYF